MKDPWERYQSEGPWTKYQSTPPKPAYPPPDPAEGMPWYERALVGAGAAFDKAARGVIGAIPFIPEADKADYLRQGKEDAELYRKHHPGGFATAGEIGADVAMSAVPVARLTKSLAALAPAGVFAPTIAANAGYAAVTSPENRLEAAGYGGAGAAAGQAVGRVLSKTLGGIKPTAQAQKVLDEGLELTPGQAGNQIHQHLENIASAYPFAAGSIKEARNKALQQWNEQVAEGLAKNLPQDLAAQVRSGVYTAAPLGKGATPAQVAGVGRRFAKRGEKLAMGPADTADAMPSFIGDALMTEARAAMPVLGRDTINASTALLPTATVLGALMHPGAAAALVIPALYGTQAGRRFLMGQTTWQEFLKTNPDMAAQVGRAIFDDVEGRP